MYCGAIMGAAKLNLPCNIIALTPLCENMPSGYFLLPFFLVFFHETLQTSRISVDLFISLAPFPCFYAILCINLPE